MSGFFALMCHFSYFGDCHWSKDSNLWAAIARPAFLKPSAGLALSYCRPVWHSGHLYLCTIDSCSIDFCCLNWAQYIGDTGLLTELPTILVSGFLVAASDVKGCLSHLCVLGSLAGSQAAAHCVQSHRRPAEVRRVREGWGKAVRALWSGTSTSTHAAHHGYWCRDCIYGEGMCMFLCMCADGLLIQSPTHNHSV